MFTLYLIQSRPSRIWVLWLWLWPVLSPKNSSLYLKLMSIQQVFLQYMCFVRLVGSLSHFLPSKVIERQTNQPPLTAWQNSKHKCIVESSIKIKISTKNLTKHMLYVSSTLWAGFALVMLSLYFMIGESLGRHPSVLTGICQKVCSRNGQVAQKQ